MACMNSITCYISKEVKSIEGVPWFVRPVLTPPTGGELKKKRAVPEGARNEPMDRT